MAQDQLSQKEICMTWVLACATIFGYGATISDTCVTFRDGRRFEMLQKVYPVGPSMIAGFAGSVHIGFSMLADMTEFLRSEGAGHTQPGTVAQTWRRRGRRLFARSDAAERNLSCSIVVVGATRVSADDLSQSHCIRMNAPQFEPEDSAVGRWTSIGNRAVHEYARHLAEDADSQQNVHAGMELGGEGGAAFSTAATVGMALQRSPHAGVGEAIQVGLATVDNCRFHDMSAELQQLDGTTKKIVCDVARSWPAYRERCRQRGYASSQAVAQRLPRRAI